MVRPRKIKFPVELDEFLRLVLLKKRPEDRIKIYREHLRTGLTPDGYAVVHRSDDEIIALIKEMRARKFNEEQYGSSTFVMGKRCYEGTGREATWVDRRFWMAGAVFEPLASRPATRAR